MVIRYEGPSGGPGMREMHRITEVVAKFSRIAVITDGRFSGASAGLSVGYLSPEAAGGGPLALVQDGDIIEIHIAERRISWLVSQQEEEKRRRDLNNHYANKERSAFLRLYGRSTASASFGARRVVE